MKKAIKFGRNCFKFMGDVNFTPSKKQLNPFYLNSSESFIVFESPTYSFQPNSISNIRQEIKILGFVLPQQSSTEAESFADHLFVKAQMAC